MKKDQRAALRSAIRARAAVFSSAVMIGHSRISSIERKQPMQQPVASSTWHTEMQGEGIVVSKVRTRTRRREPRRPRRSSVSCSIPSGISVSKKLAQGAAGATVIATSSSGEKLEYLRQLGADMTVNYRETPAWDAEVLALTGGRGVDTVVEVGGAGTLARSMNAVKTGGAIGVIGILTGVDGEVNPLLLIPKVIRLQGIYVGSRRMFQSMNAAFSANEIRPIIDRTFPFEQAPQAYAHQASGRHLGKVVISID